jgi:F0F1-type ATP synthase delta subunit
MTFAVTADPESLQQLALWLRTTINPQAVIAVGLQPSLVAGVYLRTPNHVHDLSLRAMLKNGRGLLVEELGALRGR